MIWPWRRRGAGALPDHPGFRANGPARDRQIRAFEERAQLRLPDDYVGFLRAANGGEGWIGDRYVVLFRIEELEALNQGYETGELAPGFLLIGSNGCGEAVGFDRRDSREAMAWLPFVGMNWEYATPAGPSFAAFLAAPPESEEFEGHAPPLRARGEEMHHVHPLILGGDPEAVDNLINMSREEHVKLVRWWNRLIRDLGLAEARRELGGGMT